MAPVTLSSCIPSAFSLPSLPGAHFLNLEAKLVANYSLGFPIPEGWRYSQPSIDVQNETFCNITVSYTHPGQNDTIHVESWLPVNNYNGRLQSIGGGGWVAGRFVLSYAGMIGAVHDGYATVTTDAGLGDVPFTDWALVSPGNVDLYALQNLGSVSLNDEAVIVKHFIKEYYGQPPLYSYWNGRSQGGRQGSMNAQRYPTVYDGIIAAAPAVHWSEVVLQSMWASFYMESTKQFPNSCQLQHLTELAITQCDADDGVADGIIADPDACLVKFDPAAHIGDEFICALYNSTQVITNETVNVARALWNGPVSSAGEQLWYGFNIGTDLSEIAAPNCTSDGQCFSSPSTAPILGIDLAFVTKNLTANVPDDLTSHKRFDYVYRSFKQQYDSLIGTHDPDYTDFQEAGGKIITYHGLVRIFLGQMTMSLKFAANIFCCRRISPSAKRAPSTSTMRFQKRHPTFNHSTGIFRFLAWLIVSVVQVVSPPLSLISYVRGLRTEPHQRALLLPSLSRTIRLRSNFCAPFLAKRFSLARTAKMSLAIVGRAPERKKFRFKPLEYSSF